MPVGLIQKGKEPAKGRNRPPAKREVMRAFIRHEHGLVDAGEVIEIDNVSSYGGIVIVRTAIARADVDGHVVTTS